MRERKFLSDSTQLSSQDLKHEQSKLWAPFKSTVGNVAVLLTTVFFLPVAQQTVSLLDCAWHKETAYYTLRAEPSIRCYEEEWVRTFLPVIIISFTIYGISPVVINWLVYNSQDRLFVYDSLIFKSMQGWCALSFTPALYLVSAAADTVPTDFLFSLTNRF
jgi:hypothetical protein